MYIQIFITLENNSLYSIKDSFRNFVSAVLPEMKKYLVFPLTKNISLKSLFEPKDN